ncbi:MAG: 2-amino-4-hydroxy-6-hydroxymethyldihydropteridine diphosphokinase [Acidimicrobiales bacterium]
MSTRAFLGLGTNLGDRWGHLRRAVDSLRADGLVVGVSPVYETEPVGGPEQGVFLNIVVEVATDLEPDALLERCFELERAAGRERRVRWGPRTLDVDVLWIDGFTSAEPRLIVPHPRMHERNFVMAPLLDLASDLDVPGYDPETAIGDVSVVGTLDDGPADRPSVPT